MPLRPARIEAHALATSLPTGETIPRPVTTTRRLLNPAPYEQLHSPPRPTGEGIATLPNGVQALPLCELM